MKRKDNCQSNNTNCYDVAIIGCGIIGAACGYQLAKYQISAIIMEKENDVATGATKANSAIIHAGFDPLPGSLMAKYNVAGSQMAQEIFDKLSIPYRRCGSLVLAFSAAELPVLERLYKQGLENGVKGLRILSQAELQELEPNINKEAIAALLAETAMIVSPWEYGLALAETAVRNGLELALNTEVQEIVDRAIFWEIKTNQETYHSKYIINAAGVHSDKIHNMVAPATFKIKPIRGEYYLLDKSEGKQVNHVIFQCPNEDGKGVLVAPTVHGNLIVGPNHIAVTNKEANQTSTSGLQAVAAKAQKTLPLLNLSANIRNFAGIRATSDHDDFIVEMAAERFIDLAGIASPGLSSAPAIANKAVELLSSSGLVLKPKATFIDKRVRQHFSDLSLKEKEELIQQEAAYGRIVCRCETVSEGEINAAFNQPIPPVSVDGVKRRCSPGMGRCQGGFCSPRIVDLLARHLKVSPLEILQEHKGSAVLLAETKKVRADEL